MRGSETEVPKLISSFYLYQGLPIFTSHAASPLLTLRARNWYPRTRKNEPEVMKVLSSSDRPRGLSYEGEKGGENFSHREIARCVSASGARRSRLVSADAVECAPSAGSSLVRLDARGAAQ